MTTGERKDRTGEQLTAEMKHQRPDPCERSSCVFLHRWSATTRTVAGSSKETSPSRPSPTTNLLSPAERASSTATAEAVFPNAKKHVAEANPDCRRCC